MLQSQFDFLFFDFSSFKIGLFSNNYKSMKKILQQPYATIDRLLQHSRFLDYLTRRLLTYLPDEFAEQVNVVGFKNKQQLKLACSSPAWASKLRFYTPKLKRALQNDPQFNQLQKINIKVAFSNINTKNKKNTLIYSQNAANMIAHTAEHIEDEGLRETLMSLSRHVGRGKKR